MKKFYLLFSSLYYYRSENRKTALVADFLSLSFLFPNHLQVLRLPITDRSFVAGRSSIAHGNCYEYSQNSKLTDPS